MRRSSACRSSKASPKSRRWSSAFVVASVTSLAASSEDFSTLAARRSARLKAVEATAPDPLVDLERRASGREAFGLLREADDDRRDALAAGLAVAFDLEAAERFVVGMASPSSDFRR